MYQCKYFPVRSHSTPLSGQIWRNRSSPEIFKPIGISRPKNWSSKEELREIEGTKRNYALVESHPARVACRKIIRVLRRVRSPIDQLKKGKDVLAALPHDNFRAVISEGGKQFVSLAMKLDNRQKKMRDSQESPSRKVEFNKALMEFRQARIDHHTTIVTPVFHRAKPGDLPDFIMQSESNLKISPISKNPQIHSYIPTLDELNSLVEKLYQRKDIFPWDYADSGCFARAHVMLQQLRLAGIPEKNLGKVFLLLPKHKRWMYHVAPMVKINTCVWRVVDPCINPRESTNSSIWASHESGNKPLDCLGEKNVAGTFQYDNKRYSLLTTNSKMNLRFPENSNNVYELFITSDELGKEYVKVLGEFRGQVVDAAYIDSNFRLK